MANGKSAVINEGSSKVSPGAAQTETQDKQPRVVSRPQDVASLVLMQIDAVNGKKDELTIAIKGLSDLTKQLVRAYGENTKQIQDLHQKLKTLGGTDESMATGN